MISPDLFGCSHCVHNYWLDIIKLKGVENAWIRSSFNRFCENPIQFLKAYTIADLPTHRLSIFLQIFNPKHKREILNNVSFKRYLARKCKVIFEDNGSWIFISSICIFLDKCTLFIQIKTSQSKPANLFYSSFCYEVDFKQGLDMMSRIGCWLCHQLDYRTSMLKYLNIYLHWRLLNWINDSSTKCIVTWLC